MVVVDDLAMLCQFVRTVLRWVAVWSRGLGAGRGRAPARRRRPPRVLDNGNGFEQACSALAVIEGERGRRSCSIYPARPRTCQRFVCRLYERHRREGGPIEQRLMAVRRARETVRYAVEASGMTAEAIAGEGAMMEALEDFARA